MGSVSLTPSLQAQNAFVQIGPFAFDAKTSLEAIYTTNVEQQRPSEADAEMEDYYLVWELDLKSSTEFLPRTTFTIDTGLAIEEHFKRPDLNNSENPFGRFALDFLTESEPLMLSGNASVERTSESVDDKFIPIESSISRKKRQVGTTFDYGGAARWDTKRIRLGAEYQVTQERYASDEFQELEQDDHTETYDAGVSLVTIKGIQVGVSYEIEYKLTEFINAPADESREDKTETIELDFDTLELFPRPQITYSIGIQREYINDESAGWELVHTLDVTDEYDLSPTLNLSGNISYKYEDDPEEDDIALTYGITLKHEISARAQHVFSATKEPVDTLGSTSETDSTKFNYTLSVGDFLFEGIGMKAGVEYSIDKPVASDQENTWTYDFGLEHSVPINARLTREIKYEYSLEDSNLQEELLEEHRVLFSLLFQL